MSRAGLHPRAEREQRHLDAAQDGATYTDQFGHVWQMSRDLWYRAFDSDKPLSSWELAQLSAPSRGGKEQGTNG